MGRLRMVTIKYGEVGEVFTIGNENFFDFIENYFFNFPGIEYSFQGKRKNRIYFVEHVDAKKFTNFLKEMEKIFRYLNHFKPIYKEINNFYHAKNNIDSKFIPSDKKESWLLHIEILKLHSYLVNQILRDKSIFIL